jgi:hypothetical protein
VPEIVELAVIFRVVPTIETLRPLMSDRLRTDELPGELRTIFGPAPESIIASSLAPGM